MVVTTVTPPAKAAERPSETQQRRTTPSAPPPPIVVGLLMVYLMISCAVLLYSLAELLPLPTPAGQANPEVYTPVRWFAWTMLLSDEVRLFWLVALSGALGGLVHTLRSFYWYIGNQKLMQHWLPMYLLLPFVGASIALIFYLVIRGGFFSPQSGVSQTSPFGFIALAGIIGMFSPQAVLKLQQVAETVLTKPDPGADATPQTPASTPKDQNSSNGTMRAGAAEVKGVTSLDPTRKK